MAQLRALKQLITDTVWGELDYIMDLPPGTVGIHLTLVQTMGITGAIAVTTPQDVYSFGGCAHSKELICLPMRK